MAYDAFMQLPDGRVDPHRGNPHSGDDTPIEQISFVFGKMQEEYRSQDARGRLVAGTPVQWDLTTVSDQ